jgi:hypothetical protein
MDINYLGVAIAKRLLQLIPKSRGISLQEEAKVLYFIFSSFG